MEKRAKKIKAEDLMFRQRKYRFACERLANYKKADRRTIDMYEQAVRSTKGKLWAVLRALSLDKKPSPKLLAQIDVETFKLCVGRPNKRFPEFTDLLQRKQAIDKLLQRRNGIPLPEDDKERILNDSLDPSIREY